VGKMDDEFANLVGPPGSKSKYSRGKPSDDDEETESSDEADAEAAELSAFSEYKDAMQNGTDEEGLAAFKKLRDIVR
jgi:hypothetical protein